MKRDFGRWFATLRDTIAPYSYYVDFQKVWGNVDGIRVELNILNSLVGAKDVRGDFEKLIARYPETLKCIPILLAVRKNEITVSDEEGTVSFGFKGASLPASQYSAFMEKSGLFDLLQNHIIDNLIDYVTGVETGLDSNGRKNRGGHLMENLVERHIQAAGFKKGEDYFREMYVHEISQKWGVDLSAVSFQGKAEKRFDFVVKGHEALYLVEANFYKVGGSKLNETARSYKTLAGEIAPIPGVAFVWFTDGAGWQSAKGNLEETFDVMEHLYCIQDLEDGIAGRVFK